MKTARVLLVAFEIVCPWCEQKQKRVGESTEFRPEQVEPGQIMKCQHEECRKDFRLPATLKAAGK